jgi:HEAT repeat protein
MLLPCNAIPELINYLKEKDDIIFGAASSTLSQIGSAAALLAKVMNDKKESLEVRRRAASIVSIIGAENNAAVPELIEAVADADAEISLVCCCHYWKNCFRSTRCYSCSY